MERESMDCIQVAPDGVHWWVLVNTNDVLSAIQDRESVTNWWTVGFLRNALYYIQDLTYVKKLSSGTLQGPSLNWKLPVGIAVSDWYATLKSSWHTVINTIIISFRFLLYLGAKGWVMLSTCPKSNICTARSSCLIGCAWHWVVGFLKSCSLEGSQQVHRTT